jgi:hypothetical protein
VLLRAAFREAVSLRDVIASDSEAIPSHREIASLRFAIRPLLSPKSHGHGFRGGVRARPLTVKPACRIVDLAGCEKSQSMHLAEALHTTLSANADDRVNGYVL